MLKNLIKLNGARNVAPARYTQLIKRSFSQQVRIHHEYMCNRLREIPWSMTY